MVNYISKSITWIFFVLEIDAPCKWDCIGCCSVHCYKDLDCYGSFRLGRTFSCIKVRKLTWNNSLNFIFKVFIAFIKLHNFFPPPETVAFNTSVGCWCWQSDTFAALRSNTQVLAPFPHMAPPLQAHQSCSMLAVTLSEWMSIWRYTQAELLGEI